MEIVETSPPALRANTGLQSLNAVVDGEWAPASAAARSMSMKVKRPARGMGPIAGAIVACAALQGCAANGPEPVRPLKPLELAKSAYDGNVVEQLTGALAFEHDCLLFRSDDGGPLLTPIWPDGSSFDGTSVKYHEPARQDQPLLIAQHFVMGGRRTAWNQFPTPALLPFQNQCRAEPFLVSAVRPAD